MFFLPVASFLPHHEYREFVLEQKLSWAENSCSFICISAVLSTVTSQCCLDRVYSNGVGNVSDTWYLSGCRHGLPLLKLCLDTVLQKLEMWQLRLDPSSATDLGQCSQLLPVTPVVCKYCNLLLICVLSWGY